MEMRCRGKHIKLMLRCCFIIFPLLFLNASGMAQDPLKLYTIKNGKMYIQLSKKLPVEELDKFITQYDLSHLSLKRFINTGYADSIKLNGWELSMDTKIGFILSKPMLSSPDINDPAGRIAFTGHSPLGDTRFPSVSNTVLFGYNRFRNKEPFAIKDSIATFFLRGNDKASKIVLAGSFNDWNPDGLSMTKTYNGWTASVKLTPGKYWYKFVVDGNWMIDEDNRLNENDDEGNTNSVFYFTNTVFRLKGYGNAKKVIVAGSFNNWDEKELVMQKKGDGWELPLYLAEGTHTYRFIADKDWVTDPDNSLRFPNEYNEFNSVITIGKPHVFKLDGYTNAGKVFLTGSFNKWREDELLMTKTATGWQLPYVLGSGNHEYKFIVDGQFIADPASKSSAADKPNSYLVLDPNYTFRLKGYDGSKKVFLAGDFNSWTPNSLEMKKENGEWIFRVHLTAGKHLYKFIVDDNWILDPDNKLWEQNEHNTGNSVLWIEK